VNRYIALYLAILFVIVPIDLLFLASRQGLFTSQVGAGLKHWTWPVAMVDVSCVIPDCE
jgi:hypothetical protein